MTFANANMTLSTCPYSNTRCRCVFALTVSPPATNARIHFQPHPSVCTLIRCLPFVY